MNALATIPARHGRRLRGGSVPAMHRSRRSLGAVDRASADGRHVGMDALLTADEVAALLQVTKAWVYAETRAKRIPHVPLGRYVRYRRSAVLQWISALERESSRGVRVLIGEE
jgi:excisionase family DNA binding protein